MVYLKSVENVITLGNLIGLLFLFCVSLLSILFLKTPKIRGMTCSPCNGNHCSSNIHEDQWLICQVLIIFMTSGLQIQCKLIGQAKRAPHLGVQLRFCMTYIYRYIINIQPFRVQYMLAFHKCYG